MTNTGPYSSIDGKTPDQVYFNQPIIDHFRRIDEISFLGLMQVRSVPPYFFLLTAEK